MKILHILGSGEIIKDPGAGALSGVVRAVLEYAKRQAALGHEVQIVGFGQGNWSAMWAGVKLVSLTEFSWAQIHFAGRHLDFVRHLPFVIYTLSHSFDVVHTHMHPYLRWMRGRLKVAHMHSDPLADAQGEQLAIRKAGLRQLDSQADLVVAVSHFVQKTMVDDVSTQKLRVIYNGGGFSADQWSTARLSRNVTRERLGIPADAVVILYVGAFVPAKGVHYLARTFLAIAEDYPQAHLALVGGEGLWKGNRLNNVQMEGYTEKIQHTLASVRDRTHLLGLVPSIRMAETYAAADILVVPSVWREAFGIAALEGLSGGLAVVASASGGLVELVGNDRGVLVPPGDESALKHAIAQLIGDSALRKTLGERGRAYAQQTLFEWDFASGELVGLYREYLGGRK